MILASQMYSKLFRPWDVPSEHENCDIVKENFGKDVKDTPVLYSSVFKEISEHRQKRMQADKGNKLRKVRNQQKGNMNTIHQDSTISTTTDETNLKNSEIIQENVNSLQLSDKKLEEINRRLGHTVDKTILKHKQSCNKGSAIHKRDSKNMQSMDKRETKRDAEIIHTKIPNVNSTKCKQEPSLLHTISPISSIPSYSQGFPEHMVNPLETIPYADPYSPHLQRFPNDLIAQAELAQSLGIPPNDPLLLESFAQGYAMELEYARILHQENQTKLLNARKQRPKKYKCPHCDVGFSNNGQLKGHVRIHTGERPFKCDDKNCGKTFTRNEELTRHRRIHSGLRPYPCQTCGKKFGRRDHLKKHTKTHLVQAERMMPMFVPLSAIPQIQGYPYLYGY